VNRKRRTVAHHGDEFGNRASAQSVEQFTDERFIFIELHNHRALINVCGGQFDGFIGFEKQARLGLFVAFFDDCHS